MPKEHAQSIKIQENWTQVLEECDAKHHVETIKGDCVAFQGEEVRANSGCLITGQALTSDSVTIGHNHTSTHAVMKVKANLMSDVP